MTGHAELLYRHRVWVWHFLRRPEKAEDVLVDCQYICYRPPRSMGVHALKLWDDGTLSICSPGESFCRASFPGNNFCLMNKSAIFLTDVETRPSTRELEKVRDGVASKATSRWQETM